jgi:hypothetical protein
MRSAVLLAAFLLLSDTCAAAPGRKSEVTAVEVRLFLAYTGTFSEPIHEGTTLWNAVIGEAGLTEPSNSTFVKVQISGEPMTYVNGQFVELKASFEGPRKLPERQRAKLGLFDSEGKQYLGFWLSNTGCAPIQLTAGVVGSGRAVQQLIPFKCGE